MGITHLWFKALVLIGLSISVCTHADSVTSVEPAHEAVTALISKMSLKQKIGQLLILGYSGTDFDSSLKNSLETFQPGALITFSRNIHSPYEIAELNRQAQRISMEQSQVPLLIMVDQEGGSVARIKTNPPTPSALAMGMSGETTDIHGIGRAVGDVLSLLGFNMNLAPVFDLSDPARKNFIGNRAFSGDPGLASNFAAAFAAGLAEAKIIPTGKHFPGHGNLVQDSHRSTPQKMATIDELETHDLIPFKTFFGSSFPMALMVAHVALPRVDRSRTPAAFSPIIINQVLRKKMGYEGLVITDDIEMLGAEIAGGIGERAIRAIEAGCDMVMIAWSLSRQQVAYNALLAAAKSGRLPEARIDQSLERILTHKLPMKARLNLDPEPPDDINAKLRDKFANLRELTRKINRSNFQKSAEALRGRFEPIESDRKVIVFSADEEFHESFTKAVENSVQSVALNLRTVRAIASTMKAEPNAIGVFYATGNITIRYLNALSTTIKRRLLVVNASYPGAIDNDLDYAGVVDLYTQDSLSGEWLANFFFKRDSDAPEMREPTSTPKTLDDSASLPLPRPVTSTANQNRAKSN